MDKQTYELFFNVIKNSPVEKDTKEIIHYCKKCDDGHCFCGKKINPTPSPLEGFEEMKEITDKHDVIVFGRNPLDDTFLIIKNLNQLISNQKKLYQYIKEKI
jgi:hypothetical protein